MQFAWYLSVKQNQKNLCPPWAGGSGSQGARSSGLSGGQPRSPQVAAAPWKGHWGNGLASLARPYDFKKSGEMSIFMCSHLYLNVSNSFRNSNSFKALEGVSAATSGASSNTQGLQGTGWPYLGQGHFRMSNKN